MAHYALRCMNTPKQNLLLDKNNKFGRAGLNWQRVLRHTAKIGMEQVCGQPKG
jgi:hypothetical protein